jgi:hypothetical protein
MSAKTLNVFIGVVAVLLVLGLMVKLFGQPDPAKTATTPAGPTAQAPTAVSGEGPRDNPANVQVETAASGAQIVYAGDFADEGEGIEEPSADRPPLSSLPPSELTLKDVANYVSENGVLYLDLKDGSRLMVTDFVYEQLPEGIRFRLNYQRGEQ